MNSTQADLDRFYALLALLETSPHQGKRLDSYVGSSCFPARGVYFFSEPGEYRASDAKTQRIVRVGTHAVSANAKSTLWSRLRAHYGTRSGGGNHRGSIFRLHVGAALLARDGQTLPSWGVGSTRPDSVRNCAIAQAAEAAWERKVSAYIGAMSVLWIDVPDEPGPSSMRAHIEQNSIALLSNSCATEERSSPDWLGRHSPRSEIRDSRLWNLNHVSQKVDRSFFNDLEVAVQRTVASWE